MPTLWYDPKTGYVRGSTMTDDALDAKAPLVGLRASTEEVLHYLDPSTAHNARVVAGVLSFEMPAQPSAVAPPAAVPPPPESTPPPTIQPTTPPPGR